MVDVNNFILSLSIKFPSLFHFNLDSGQNLEKKFNCNSFVCLLSFTKIFVLVLNSPVGLRTLLRMLNLPFLMKLKPVRLLNS